jgi:hypothetical protein
MVLAAARKKKAMVNALERPYMILQMKEMKIDLHLHSLNIKILRKWN